MKLKQQIYKLFLAAVDSKGDGTTVALFKLFQFAFFAVIAILAINLVGLYIGKTETFGQWGDFFGGVLNPILTFLMFMGLLITIVIQKTELKESRIEFSRSADALTHQSRSIDRQNFESTFFHLLNTHTSLVASIDLLNSDGHVTKGRDCFNVFYTRLTKIYRTKQPKKDNLDDREKLNFSYNSFWKVHQTELGHYFRYLYNIVKFIDESDYANGPYIKFLRAQLSDQELLLLFYNCLSPQGESFVDYLIRYKILDNMPIQRLLEKHHINYLPKDVLN